MRRSRSLEPHEPIWATFSPCDALCVILVTSYRQTGDAICLVKFSADRRCVLVSKPVIAGASHRAQKQAQGVCQLSGVLATYPFDLKSTYKPFATYRFCAVGAISVRYAYRILHWAQIGPCVCVSALPGTCLGLVESQTRRGFLFCSRATCLWPILCLVSPRNAFLRPKSAVLRYSSAPDCRSPRTLLSYGLAKPMEPRSLCSHCV